MGYGGPKGGMLANKGNLGGAPGAQNKFAHTCTLFYIHIRMDIQCFPNSPFGWLGEVMDSLTIEWDTGAQKVGCWPTKGT